jgi:hypothetical protein
LVGGASVQLFLFLSGWGVFCGVIGLFLVIGVIFLGSIGGLWGICVRLLGTNGKNSGLEMFLVTWNKRLLGVTCYRLLVICEKKSGPAFTGYME